MSRRRRDDPPAIVEGPLAQFADGFLARLAAADELDDFVDIDDREDKAFENMPALLRFAELEVRPPGDDFLAMLDEMLDQFLQPHRARLAVDQRDVDHADGDLARRVLIKLIDDHVRIGVALQVDDDAAGMLAAGFVVDGADVLDGFLLHGTRRRLRRSLCGSRRRGFRR